MLLSHCCWVWLVESRGSIILIDRVDTKRFVVFLAVQNVDRKMVLMKIVGFSTKGKLRTQLTWPGDDSLELRLECLAGAKQSSKREG
jgi:hypothetical protein